MFHIIERFLIHFASATFILLCFYFLLGYIIRRSAWFSRWIRTEKTVLLIISLLLVVSVFNAREVYDAWAGNNSFLKSITDMISWWLGAVIGAWALYRFGGAK